MSRNPPDPTLTYPRKLQRGGEDILCIDCGYSLRGLSGDRIRCPECGAERALTDLQVPPELVAKWLRRMESLPALSVLGMWVVLLGVIELGSAWSLTVQAIGALVCVGAALLFGRATRFTPGWWAVLGWHYAAGGLWLVLLLTLGLAFAEAYVVLPKTARLLVCCAGALATLVGPRLPYPAWLGWIGAPYRHAKARLSTVCRVAATAMAYRELHGQN